LENFNPRLALACPTVVAKGVVDTKGVSRETAPLRKTLPPELRILLKDVVVARRC